MMAFLIELGHSASSIETSLLLTKQKLPILKSVTMKILRATNKTPEEKTIIPERDFLMVQKPFLDPVSLPINGTDKLTDRLMMLESIIITNNTRPLQLLDAILSEEVDRNSK